jgi:uncharacterized membrane protein YedE/YeeE
MDDAIPSCPSAPLHGHAALLGWVGMTLFGLVYRMLPGWSSGRPPSLLLARAHFVLSVVGVVRVLVNGSVGYELLNLLSPEFYYEPDEQILHLWFGVDGLFLSLYGVGCVLFLVVLLRSTSYRDAGHVAVAEKLSAL